MNQIYNNSDALEIFRSISLFNQDITLDKISAIRDKFYGYDKYAFYKQTREVSIDNPCMDETGRYKVKSKSTTFDCLFFLPSTSIAINKLYVSFSSANVFGKNRKYPTFTRWTYYNILDGYYICIEDPMYKRYPNAGATWFFGNKNASYVDEIKLLIAHLMVKYNILPSNVYFTGSSQGGSVAIMLGNLVNNSNVFAMNPQYDPAAFSIQCVNFFQEHLNVDIHDSSLTNFNFIPNNYTSRFFICTNCNSKSDFIQLEILSKIKTFPIFYGIHQYDNLTLWNHFSGESHTAFPEKLLFLFCLYYIDLIKNNISLVGLNAFHILMSEMLYQRYSLFNINKTN